MSTHRKVCLAILGLAVVAGGWLRLASLGRLSAWDDEFPHMIAGRALLAEGRAALPSGRSYRRALAQTVAVGASMKVGGGSEGAARVPSALAGIATIPVVWVLARKRFGSTAAVAAAAAVALTPLHVAHARSARFYVAFVLAYACAVFFGSRALRSGRRRDVAAAAGSFALALHLQSLALLIVLPLAADAAMQWRYALGAQRARGRATTLALLGAGAVGAALVAIAAAVDGDAVARAIRTPVPSVAFDPALRLNTLGRLFTDFAPWAWIVLGPAAAIGLRRAGRDGAALALHAVLPALALSLLYRRLGSQPRGIDVRYLIHLRLLVSVVAGVGIATLLRETMRVLRLPGRLRALEAVAAATLAITSIAGAGRVARLPGEQHPGGVIPRANWRAAAAVLRPALSPGDGLLTTSTMAASWYVGTCGAWLRSSAAAAPFVDGGHEIYCGSTVVSSFAQTRAFMAAHPRGWVLADAWWALEVDESSRAFIEARAQRVPVPDPTVLLYRWG